MSFKKHRCPHTNLLSKKLRASITRGQFVAKRLKWKTEIIIVRFIFDEGDLKNFANVIDSIQENLDDTIFLVPSSRMKKELVNIGIKDEYFAVHEPVHDKLGRYFVFLAPIRIKNQP